MYFLSVIGQKILNIIRLYFFLLLEYVLSVPGAGSRAVYTW